MVDERAYLEALSTEQRVERSFRIDAKGMSERTLEAIARSRQSRLSTIAALEHRRRREIDRVLRGRITKPRSRLARFHAAALRDPSKIADPSLLCCGAASLRRLAGQARRWTTENASAHRDAVRRSLAAHPSACAQLVRRAALRAPCLLGEKYGTYRDMLLLAMQASEDRASLEDRVREDVLTVLDKSAGTERLLMSSPDAVDRATMLRNAADLLSEVMRESRDVDGRWDLLRRRVFLAIGDFCDAILSNGMMAYQDTLEHQAVVMRAAAELGPVLSELASRYECVRCVMVSVACFMAAIVRSAWVEMSTHGAYAHRAVRVFRTFPGLPSAAAAVIVPTAGQHDSKEHIHRAWIALLDASVKHVKLWYDCSRRGLLCKVEVI